MTTEQKIRKSLSRRNLICTIGLIIGLVAFLLLILSFIVAVVLIFISLAHDPDEKIAEELTLACWVAVITFGVCLMYLSLTVDNLTSASVGIQDMFWCRPTKEHFAYLTAGNAEMSKMYDIAANNGVYFSLGNNAVIVNITGLTLPEKREFSSMRFCEMYMEHKENPPKVKVCERCGKDHNHPSVFYCNGMPIMAKMHAGQEWTDPHSGATIRRNF